MSQQQREFVDQLLRESPFDLGGDPVTQRPMLEQMLTAHPAGDDVLITSGNLGGVPALFVDIYGVDAKGIGLLLHGGGFVLGSAAGAVGLAADLARRTQMQIIALDYRLAPEHPFPAALDDSYAAYGALLDLVTDARCVAVIGESAGGNLAVAVLVLAQRAGLPQPAAAVVMSPLADLTVSADSYTTKAHVDPKITADAIRTRVRDYVGNADPTNGLLSPVFADLTGLPPLLIQAGSHEVLLDDSLRLAERAARDNVNVTLDVTPGVPHVFQAFAGVLDEGDAALARAAQFLHTHVRPLTAAAARETR